MYGRPADHPLRDISQIKGLGQCDELVEAAPKIQDDSIQSSGTCQGDSSKHGFRVLLMAHSTGQQDEELPLWQIEQPPEPRPLHCIRGPESIDVDAVVETDFTVRAGSQRDVSK